MDGIQTLNTVEVATPLPGAPGTPILPVEPLELDLAHVQGVPPLAAQDNAGQEPATGDLAAQLPLKATGPAPEISRKRTADGGIIVASPQHRRLLHTRTVRRYLRGLDAFRAMRGKVAATMFLPERLKARRVPRVNEPGRKPEHEAAFNELRHARAILFGGAGQ